MNKIRFAANVGLLGLSLGGVMLTSSAHAQTFLVGAYLFGADGTGATNNVVYQFDTNSVSGALPLLINSAGKGFTAPLALGANSFTFSGSQAATLGPGGDLGLFFNTTNTPYAPSSGTARTPDLIVSRDTSGALAFFVPSAGTTLNNYTYSSPTVGANGLTTFNIGGNLVTVSAYSVNTTPSGSFTLAVSQAPATPEPGSVALLVGMGISGGVFAARRRRRTVTK